MSLLGEKRRRNMLDMYPFPISIEPLGGLIGLVVTITGSGLAGTTGVNIGGLQSLLVIVIDDTTVTAVVPALSLGNKPVIVQSLAGNALVPGGFTVSLV